MTGYKSKRAAAQDKLDSMEREALKLAQQMLESLPGFRADIDNALDAIKEALAQPAQNHMEDNLTMVEKPAAQELDVVMHCESHTWTIYNPPPKGSGDVNLYYTPPQRPWVDLTEDQIKVIEEMALTKQWAIRMAIAQLKECNASSTC